jgi:prephenate dehydratase
MGQKKLKIAIQGGPASFHEVAAQQYFTKDTVEPLACQSFQQLCDVLEQGEADYAVMAIENALAGSILTNYTLLQLHSFSVIGEQWLPIDQNIMALPGQKMEDITTVISHPVALLQCGDFLKRNPHIQPQESHDTADSAREIKEKQLKGVAAIASKQAARLYGMELLEEHIADRNDNYTRFLVLSRAPQHDASTPADKASLILQLPHANNSLGAVVNKLYTSRVNVSLIQSIPAPPHNTSHNVAIDIECADYARLMAAIEELTPLVQDLQLLGLYHKGLTPLLLEYSEKLLTPTYN